MERKWNPYEKNIPTRRGGWVDGRVETGDEVRELD